MLSIVVATALGVLLTPCSPQDQLSADMYSFVAKEIDYANYFQTVSAASRPLPSAPRCGCPVPVPAAPAAPHALGALSPQLIEVQAEYHRKSLALLQNVLPQIKAQQGECTRGSSRSRGGDTGDTEPITRRHAGSHTWLCRQADVCETLLPWKTSFSPLEM